MNFPLYPEIPMNYSEVLRVVGAYLDRAQLDSVRIIETDNGLIVQGKGTQGPELEVRATYELTVEDIEALLRDALAQRGKRI